MGFKNMRVSLAFFAVCAFSLGFFLQTQSVRADEFQGELGGKGTVDTTKFDSENASTHLGGEIQGTLHIRSRSHYSDRNYAGKPAGQVVYRREGTGKISLGFSGKQFVGSVEFKAMGARSGPPCTIHDTVCGANRVYIGLTPTMGRIQPVSGAISQVGPNGVRIGGDKAYVTVTADPFGVIFDRHHGGGGYSASIQGEMVLKPTDALTLRGSVEPILTYLQKFDGKNPSDDMIPQKGVGFGVNGKLSADLQVGENLVLQAQGTYEGLQAKATDSGEVKTLNSRNAQGSVSAAVLF